MSGSSLGDDVWSDRGNAYEKAQTTRGGEGGSSHMAVIIIDVESRLLQNLCLLHKPNSDFVLPAFALQIPVPFREKTNSTGASTKAVILVCVAKVETIGLQFDFRA